MNEWYILCCIDTMTEFFNKKVDTNLCIFVVRFRATKRCDFSTALKGMSYIQGL